MRTRERNRIADATYWQLAARHARFEMRTPAALVLAAFAVTRVLGHIAGVRSDASFLQSAWQLLDLRWLREDLVGSLVSLHSQPPLFNLLVGVLAATVPGHEGLVLRITYLVLGATLALAMLDLLRRLGVSAGIAIGTTLLVVLSPATLLYESWLFYPYPLAAVLLLSAWAQCQYGARQTFSAGALAFGLAAIPALTWSLFHVVWLVLVVILVAVLSGAAPKRTFSAAAVPLVLVLAWYGKNLVLFGQPAASSWFGQNLFRVATGGLPADERGRLVADIGISDLALVRAFSPLEAYRPYIEMPQPTGSSALDQERKDDGTPNFNHVAYIAISQRYLELAQEIIRNRPSLYAGTVVRGVCRFSLPTTNDGFLESNRHHIRWAGRMYDAVIFGQLRTPPIDSDCTDWTPAQFPFVFPLLLLVSIVGPTSLALQSSERSEVRATMAFVAFTMVWVTMVANAFEFGENNRFRFVTEPLMFVGLGVSAHRAFEAWRRRPRATTRNRQSGQERSTRGAG